MTTEVQEMNRLSFVDKLFLFTKTQSKSERKNQRSINKFLDKTKKETESRNFKNEIFQSHLSNKSISVDRKENVTN